MKKAICSIGIGLGCVLATSLASAQETAPNAQHGSDKDYCDKVQARAKADAWLLFSPSLQLQGIKYPAGAPGVVAVGGEMTADGYQVRGSLAWSPLDAYKGTQVLSLADKDCLQHSATVDAQNLLEQMNDVGRASALQAEVSYLQGNTDDMNNILTNMQKRLGVGNITLVDVMAVQQQIAILQRKLAIAQGQLAIVKAKDYVSNPSSSSEIAAKLQRYSAQYEKQFSNVRMFDPWEITVSGGVVPPIAGGMIGTDSWFGMVGITYNLGGLTRSHYESQYQDARSRELQHARYELVDQIRRLQDGIHAGIEASTSEIQALDKHITELLETKKQLADHVDAPNTMSALALVNLQIMDAVSDRLYLIALHDQLTEWK